MCKNQLNINKQAEMQEETAHNKEGEKSIKTNHTTKKNDRVSRQGCETTITRVFHTFKKLEDN